MNASREYPSRPFLAASVAVFRDGRVLLGARRIPPYDNVFTLPGGLVEPGETLEQAALRELFEETGVRAEIAGFIDHVEIVQNDDDGQVRRHFVIAAFAARWISGEGEAGEELSRLVWSDPACTGIPETTPGLTGILARAREIVG
jgi:8-oxo-dGTP diphosphatase